MKIINKVSIVLLIAVWPLALLLPDWAFWENNWIENIEALILLGGFVMTLKWSMSGARSERWLWLSAAVLFLVALGRELSWGRVFYPMAWTANGPEFPGIHEVWFGAYVPWFLGAMAIVLSIAVWRGRTLIITLYKEHLSDRTLLIYLAIFIGGLVLGETLFEKNMVSLWSAYHQNLEEMAELCSYWSAIALVFRVKELVCAKVESSLIKGKTLYSLAQFTLHR